MFPKANSQNKGFYPSEVQYVRTVAVTLRHRMQLFLIQRTHNSNGEVCFSI